MTTKKSGRIKSANTMNESINYEWYAPNAIHDILSKMRCVWCKTGEKTIRYTLNAPLSFDIETTSTYIKNSKNENEKFAFMYAWAFDIDDKTIIGRTWAEFTDMMQIISNQLELNENRRIIVYVHNLSYEFQFIQHRFKWSKIFATEIRKPLYAITDFGIEFRCSYRLSGYSLNEIGKQIGIKKLLGDLDYTLIRHYKTELKPHERNYLIHDVKIVSEYIRRKIKEESGIIHIPLTKTGYVRRLFRQRCLHGKEYTEYMQMISSLQMSMDEYDLVKDAYAGGFTHSNFLKTNKVFHNVTSFDIASSYPCVLVAEKYPCGKGRLYRFQNKKHLRREMYNPDYAYILRIEIENVKPIFKADNFISYSKCLEISGDAVVNNGRVYSASRMVLAITNIDFRTMEKCYKFDIVACELCYRYELDYLPKPFIETLMELYEKKTTLKGLAGFEEMYLSAKEDINSAYGMMVTEILRDVIEYKDGWILNGEPPEKMKQLTADEKEKQLKKENEKRARFLFYVWGCFVTSYARSQNLWSAILECKGDYIYSDTDSVKILNAEKHMKFFEEYNKNMIGKIENALRYHGLKPELSAPKTKSGKPKPLGVFEFDGHYSDFKTLGAKRYFYRYSNDTRNEPEKRGEYVLTVAGLSKRDALKYIINTKRKESPFDFFRWGMYIPAENTGKNTHTYIDTPMQATITDYTGKSAAVHELSAVHLSPQDYKLSLGKQYAEFLNGKHDCFEK